MTTLSRRALLGSALALPFAGDALAFSKPRDLPPEPVPITVEARRLNGFKHGAANERRFGGLEWIGGLELTSSDTGFGGISGMSLDATGRKLLAVSDAGIWVEGTLTTDGEVPTGLGSVRLCPMRALDGSLLTGRPPGDAEALTVRDGQALVAFENANRVLSYALSGGLTAIPTLVSTPDAVRSLARARGIEAMAFASRTGPQRGALILIAEDPPRGMAEVPGWIVGGPLAGEFSLKPDGFSATDLATLPNGDFLLLERRVRLPFGVWMRVRRFEAASLRPGASLTGSVLLEAGLDHAVDNMEAMAVHTSPDGGVIVTIMSDDNFNVLQRNLLLRFRLL